MREIITATHSGMTTDQFDAIVADWLANTKDSRFNCFYTELIYQPMLELLLISEPMGSRRSSSRVPAKTSYVSSPTRRIVSHRSR